MDSHGASRSPVTADNVPLRRGAKEGAGVRAPLERARGEGDAVILSGRRVLVTGAGGALGRRVVAALSARGCLVQGLVRRRSHAQELAAPNVRVVCGDVTDAVSLRAAFQGAEYVVHAAADTRGHEAEDRSATIAGTRNVLALCEEYGTRKLVYISSCGVYGTAGCAEGQFVDEESPLEPFPKLRGAYSSAKAKAEALVSKAMSERRFPIVRLRPGTYAGGGAGLFSPMLGYAAGRRLFVIIDKGDLVLPLVSVENVADAVAVCLEHEESGGRTYNVVDDGPPTKRQYVATVLKKVYPAAIFLFVPYTAVRAMVRVQEVALRALGRSPLVTVYRLESSQRSVVYDGSRIRRELGWTPPAALEDVLRQETAMVWGGRA